MTDKVGDNPSNLEAGRRPSANQTSLKKRSVVVAGHRTSVSLESAFWQTLRDFANAQGKTVNRLITEIDQGRSGNLSSAIRIFILNTLLARTNSGLEGSDPSVGDHLAGDHLAPGKD